MFNRFQKSAATVVTVLMLHAAGVWAQSAIDPVLLQQLSPEDQQKALRAFQGGTVESSDGPGQPMSSNGLRIRTDSIDTRRQKLRNAPVQQDGNQLPLFGYALFSAAGNEFQPSPDVPVPQNYVLGPGDVVRVQLFGNQNETLNLSITRDGAINFPKLGPIQVAGLSVDDARAVIDRRVAKELIGVQTNLTLGPLRGMQVFLLGDAIQPGAYSVSGFATITNALTAGGGIATSGSLRKIELKRAGRVVQRLDLYDFLLRGDSSRDIRLQPGDAVFIPAAGPRIAIAGAVTRPAVYEITGPITVKAALELAGGLAGDARLAQASLEGVGVNGQRQLWSLNLSDATSLATTLGDGDRLEVASVYERADNPVTVLGHVRYEKSFAWNPGQTLSRVLAQAEVRPSEPGRELYPVMALIERSDAATGLRNWRGFDLTAVQTGTADEAMEALDRVVILTRSDIAYLLAPEVRNALKGELPRPVAELAVTEATAERANPAEAIGITEGLRRKTVADAGTRSRRMQMSKSEVCPALLEVVKTSDSARARSIRVLLEAQVNAAENRFSQADTAEKNQHQVADVQVACPSVFTQAPSALPYLLENSAGLVGELRQPGLYPFVPGTPIGRLTAVAGGDTGEANRGEVEFFDANESIAGGLPRFRKMSRDAAFAQQPAMKAVYKFLPAGTLPEVGAVNIRGEVRFPGRYVVARGERYSELLARAGGLSDQAFAYGTVFTRVSAREQEASANRRAAADLRESLVSAVTRGVLPSSGTATGNDAVLDLVRRLETTPAVGRVVIEADPVVLGIRTEADFLLEPGDEIFIPKRPNAVAVTGQVLSPGSLAFVNGARPEDYIRQAGGYAVAADASRSFIVLPNGVARPLRQSFWHAREEAIPPGSVIIVPRDVAPFTALILSERITSILSNLALSAAALVTITR